MTLVCQITSRAPPESATEPPEKNDDDGSELEVRGPTKKNDDDGSDLGDTTVKTEETGLMFFLFYYVLCVLYFSCFICVIVFFFVIF